MELPYDLRKKLECMGLGDLALRKPMEEVKRSLANFKAKVWAAISGQDDCIRSHHRRSYSTRHYARSGQALAHTARKRTSSAVSIWILEEDAGFQRREGEGCPNQQLGLKGTH
jgi:hypothetical protein